MYTRLSGDPNQEFKLKDTAIAIKKKQIELEVHRQLDLAHQSTRTYGADKKVLQEEDYVASLERIIERDFFPDLKKLQMNEEWLLARKNDDHEKMRAIQQRYKNTRDFDGTMERIETPNFKDTPLATPSVYHMVGEDGEPIVNSDPIKEITQGNNLTSFHKKYANEDDVSFSKIMGEEILEHRKRFWWKNLNQQNQLQLESSSELKAIGWAEPGENVLIFNPKGMKAPELVNPPKMSSSNTRFQEDPFSSITETKEEEQSKEMELLKLLTKQQNSKYRTQQPTHNQKSDKVDLDELFGGERQETSKTSINGFELIQQDEILKREEDPNKIPLLLDKNLVLGKNGNAGKAFLVPETPSRQQVGIALANTAHKNILKRNQQNKNVSSVHNTPRSDAAKRIAAQMSHRSMLNSDPQLRSSYSPSPRKRGSGIQTPNKIITPSETTLKRRHSTPIPTSSLFSKEEESKKKKLKSQPPLPSKSKSYSSITDDLL